ncbi:hypothetical protein, partial [Borreliella valaisiana]|uniref:hypothetical protein n=1 Tax=Borreliella valaisiana TaxID=62088 RepID=UPI001AEF567F
PFSLFLVQATILKITSYIFHQSLIEYFVLFLASLAKISAWTLSCLSAVSLSLSFPFFQSPELISIYKKNEF